MKIPVSGAAFTLAVCSAVAEPSDKEVIALINRVQEAVGGGDMKAADELTSLPGHWAAPAFLMIFKQNYNVADSTLAQRAIGARCARLLVTTDGCPEYVVKLLKGKPANNNVFYQQDSAIKCLALVHNKISVQILGGALAEIDPEEIGPKLTHALAELNLPEAPLSPID